MYQIAKTTKSQLKVSKGSQKLKIAEDKHQATKLNLVSFIFFRANFNKKNISYERWYSIDIHKIITRDMFYFKPSH